MFWIWTQLAAFISNDDNRLATSASNSEESNLVVTFKQTIQIYF